MLGRPALSIGKLTSSTRVRSFWLLMLATTPPIRTGDCVAGSRSSQAEY
ncbi:Uncharacterised protein [Vibrio cholerae]|nr:Uncharacterised protein [Vibrio cholerae]